MNVQMINSLSRSRPIVDYDSVSADDSFLASDHLSDEQQVSQKRRMLRRCGVQRRNVLPGYDQDVSPRLRIRVPERNRPVIFFDDSSRLLVSSNFAENTILQPQLLKTERRWRTGQFPPGPGPRTLTATRALRPRHALLARLHSPVRERENRRAAEPPRPAQRS